MVNIYRLMILSDLRHSAGITLTQMAQACGLYGKKSCESASAWERGKSIPHMRIRPKFIAYLCTTLGLWRDSVRLQHVWQTLVDEWGWEPLSPEELNRYSSATITLQHPSTVIETSLCEVCTTGVQGDLPANSYMPLSRRGDFRGRKQELWMLASLLTPQENDIMEYSYPYIVVWGDGHVGKTQLAIEFAYAYGHRFAGGVCWINCADPYQIPSEIAACGASLFRHHQTNFHTLSLYEQVGYVFAAWEHPLPRLIIFDGCEDALLLQAWCPKRGGCRILVTSRYALWNKLPDVSVFSLSIWKDA